MMKQITFLISSLISITLICALDSRIKVSHNDKTIFIPPLAKFFDPFHGFWQNAEPIQQVPSLPEQIEGIQDQVEVSFDTLMIPHVYAKNNHDLYFLQGYLTAKDRLWQMEILTAIAAGRLSEIIGKKGLENDIEHRRKALKKAAVTFIDEADKTPGMSEIFSAYTEGVNAYINSLSYKDYPIEYKLLNYQPEEWSALKCGLLIKSVANELSGFNSDIEFTNALFLFGKETFNQMYPELIEEYHEPIVSAYQSFTPLEVGKPHPSGFISSTVNKTFAYEPHPDNGSNNWAVSGAKTRSGNPILSNDPHLTLMLPSVWYAIHLQSDDMNVQGATIPGFPCIGVGFNEDIAWGVTNARRDVMDWYSVKFKDNKKDEYLLDGKWMPVQKEVEKIFIRDQGVYTDTVLYTQWGPVVYSDQFEGENHYYALKWVAHEPSTELEAFYKVNKARNKAEFEEAVQKYSCPAQNFVFASNQGDIGIRVQGRFPLKWKEQGKFIMDGSLKEMEWNGYIPTQHNVEVFNPEKGYVSSANQYPVPADYPYYVFDPKYEYYRNRRINSLLESMNDITVEDMEEMLNDNYNMIAAENLCFLLDEVRMLEMSKEESAAFELLSAWDYNYHQDLLAPVYFEQWSHDLSEILWDELVETNLPTRLPTDIVTFNLLRNNPEFELIDVKTTTEKETVNQLILKSFQSSVKKVKEWKEQKDHKDWADFRNTDLQHLFNLNPFNIPIKNGGNHHIVNATTNEHGPSWRMVVELTKDGPHAKMVYPGGQSGNPGSPYYSSMVKNWEDCELYEMKLLPKGSKDAFVANTNIIQPKK
ncbi:penicillin acylase family protein [Sediminitomix flava]|uniref:Penicillin amidase n=1 Tax=Sediminitomix flava TaxID=379075 RepID=A0A315ZHB4_SEDFL|nr:penicillin acylase family protein [Sediminitomix flava]PWJ44540.1 penicillin amidase [Sediminitomix flava]